MKNMDVVNDIVVNSCVMWENYLFH